MNKKKTTKDDEKARIRFSDQFLLISIMRKFFFYFVLFVVTSFLIEKNQKNETQFLLIAESIKLRIFCSCIIENLKSG